MTVPLAGCVKLVIVKMNGIRSMSVSLARTLKVLPSVGGVEVGFAVVVAVESSSTT